MAYDGKLLARAREKLEQVREKNQQEHTRRVQQIAVRIPEIAEIDARMSSQMRELFRLTISRRSDTAEQIARLKNENLSLQMRKAELLVENGYPSDYLADLYSCPICKDTGNHDSRVCVCLERIYKSELSKELSPLLRRGDECFENFNLSYYPEDYSDAFRCAPREYMAKVYAICKKFADSFPDVSSNLLLSGNPGLGKTYLSACIARSVSERGYSVCYDSAVSAFDAFETQKFSRSAEEAEAAGNRVRRMLDCDLMILDDLGTELITPGSVSALYTLINTRMNEGKHLVINTTFSMDDLARRYSPSVVSRLEGEFLLLQFVGNDIRQLRKSL